MSLLDQLSSLCGSNDKNAPRFSSFLDCQLQPSPKRSASMTPSKTIKLFNESELSYGASSAKKQNPTLEFNALNEADKNKEKLKQLTKMSLVLNKKIRKHNYELFVRLEKHSQAIQTQMLQLQAQKKSTLLKLSDSLTILQIKYSEEFFRTNSGQLCAQSFDKIKNFAKKKSAFEKMFKLVLKSSFLCFAVNLKKISKEFIKVEIFANNTQQIIIKTVQSAFESLKNHHKEENCAREYAPKVKIVSIREIKPQINEQTLLSLQPEEQSLKAPNSQTVQVKKSNILPTTNKSISFLSTKAFQNASITHQFFQVDWPYNTSENIPLKLYPFKSHEEQINLPDCIDNGHLLMNQIRNNLGLQSEISSINTSLIGTHQNSITSLNENLVVKEQHRIENIMQQVEAAFSKPQEQSGSTTEVATMRKSLHSEPMSKHVKKPRSSLVITRKPEHVNKGQIRKNTAFVQRIHQNIKEQTETTLDKESLRKMLNELQQKYGTEVQALPNSKAKNTPVKNSHQKSQKPISHLGTHKNSETVSLSSSYVEKKSSGKKQFKSSKESNSLKIDFHKFKASDAKVVREKARTKSYHTRNSFELDSSFNSIRLQYNEHIKNLNIPSKAEKIEKTIDQIHCYEARPRNGNSMIEITSQKTQNLKKALPKGENVHKNKSFSVQEQNQKKIQPNSYSKEKFFLNGSVLAQNWQSKKQCKHQQVQENPDWSFSESIISQKNPGERDQVAIDLKKEFDQNSGENSYQIKSKNGNLPSSNDSLMEEYISCLPSELLLPFQEQKSNRNPEAAENSKRVNPMSKFGRQNKSKAFQSSKRDRQDKGEAVKKSLEKSKQSFEKKKQNWQEMFCKQKSKFLKVNSAKKSEKKSSINNSVIQEIKAKIEKCILGTKDLNTEGLPKDIKGRSSVSFQRRQRKSIINLKPYPGK